MHPLKSLIAVEKATFLWNNNLQINMSSEIGASLVAIWQTLEDTTKQWKQPIGFIIERDAHIITLGDASGYGGGAYCEKLYF